MQREPLSTFITTSKPSKTSMDSSNSCNQLRNKEVNLESIETVGINKQISINSPSQILSFLDSEIRNTSQINSVTHEQLSIGIIEDSKKTKVNDLTSKMFSRAGLNFLPGSKLEAKDFNEKWYSARVVETDWIEREVLIHFDKWSSRYDEWIPMDSSRLRMLQTHTGEIKLKEFEAGEKILATWVDGKKYPAKVNAVLGNDKYDILFDDGYSKILKSSKITKLLEISGSKLEDKNNYVGSKQERRDKKRKHTITELFYSHSKKKPKNENEKIYKKQDLTDVRNIKCVSNNISTGGLIKSQNNIRINNYQNDHVDKIKKIKKEIFKYNIDSENIVSKWFYKNSDNISNKLEDYATFIGNLRVEIEDSTYKCPKTGCNKNFRNENLLQMHIKHYHPEYSKFLGITPNVADLAYARTIGESVDDFIPKKSRIINSQPTPIIYGTIQSISHVVDKEFVQTALDNKLDKKLVAENISSPNEDNSSEKSNSCTMSPGRLFDMRFKEEKVHTGIKTLPPVRQPSTGGPDNNEQMQCCNNVNEPHKQIILNDKGKIFKKKHQHSYDSLNKIKKQQIILENEETYDHYDDILVDDDDLDINYKNNLNNFKFETNSNNIQYKNDEIIINGELIKVEKLRKEEIINCTCGIIEEDGLMIQCDLCLCWQHGHCNAIEKEKDVPEKYICYICQHAHRQRTSKKYFHDQDWIHEGKLPSIYNYSSHLIKSKERTAMLKRSYELIAGLLQIQNSLHSLRVKVNVTQNKDHPKLYLWAKNWSKIKICTSKIEPIPIMEIIKSERFTDYVETNVKKKLEFSFSGNDSEQKLITSDTELMKILEEDSTQAEESKSLIKNSASINLIDDGKILLDALTRNEFDEKNKKSLIKIENNTYNLPVNENSNTHSEKPKILSHMQIEAKPSILSQAIIPQPEAPIDPFECKLRLLEHIDHFQSYIDSTLSFIEVQLCFLENININEKYRISQHIQTKQTIQMLLHDLELMRKLATLC